MELFPTPRSYPPITLPDFGPQCEYFSDLIASEGPNKDWQISGPHVLLPFLLSWQKSLVDDVTSAGGEDMAFTTLLCYPLSGIY